MNKNIYVLFLALCCFSIISCRSIKQANTFKDCSYTFAKISNLKVGDISIQGKQSFKDLATNETIGLSQLLMAKKMPISLTAHVKIKNPNSKTAAIDALDWILLVHDKEIANGIITDRIEIEPNQSILIPIDIVTDLGSILKTFSIQEITQIIFNISNISGIPVEAKLKIKPSITVGKKQIKSPSYFNIDIPTK